MELILPDLWFALIGFILFVALVADGFDLGVGILSLFTRDEPRRTLLMGSIGPVWHANLTWLVVLGGVFFGAFPVAYGVMFAALYLPVFVMIIALAFRGVSFDFREEARDKGPWNLAFGLGSLAAALAQGFAVGGFLGGLHLAGDRFGGSVWDWLNPFAALVALGLVWGYVLPGPPPSSRPKATWRDYYRMPDATAAPHGRGRRGLCRISLSGPHLVCLARGAPHHPSRLPGGGCFHPA
jgi:cytochrome d ubiquinol oxidase subunit II